MYFVNILSCFVLSLLVLTQDTTAQQVVCGPALYEVLDGICMNGYQAMELPKRKRSHLPHVGLEVGVSGVDSLPLPMDGINNMSLDKLYGDIANVMAKTRRRRFGIYDECCRKGCTFNELATYCS